ncbi:PepSY domain-containing protein [Brochothrix campestris]|uniref:Lipoprotein n=1 Tax=Brochothrix campestris FSL F6-1037 TaxID=1265861 RepID=W7D9S8_9LIST|nr:PepSY domain-containing protein [Brochothrix campestris]EUJ42013.1 lipoprotein [Brochothrix campestris FSL F6-1037]
MKLSKIITLTALGFGLASVGVLAGCQDDKATSATPTEKTETAKTTENNNATNDATQKLPKVTVAEAIDTYQKEFPNSDITSIELDSSFSKWYYQVEGVDDNKEYEVKIDAEKNTVKDSSDKKLDRDDQNGIKRAEDKLDLNKLASLKDVTDIALTKAEGTATDWSLDKELNVTYWSVTIENGKNETEVKINASSKEVIEIEQDN